MWAAWILGLIATWVMALAGSLPLFVAGMLLYGTTMFVMAPLSSYITAARGKWSVARALTLVSAAYNAGAVLGPTLGGFIGNGFGYRTIFFVSACIFAASTALILLIHPQPIESPQPEEKDNHLFKNSRYLAFVGIYFLAVFSMYLPQPLSPNFLQNQRGYSLVQIGQLYSISSLGIVISNLVLGHLDVRWGYLIGQAGVGIFALLLWQGKSIPWYILAYLLLGGFRTTRSLATAYIRSMVSGSTMGLAYGLAETIAAMATMVAPPLAGYLYQAQPTRIYALSTGLIALSLVVSALFGLYPSKPEPEPSPSTAVKVVQKSQGG
jgi:predicted MFS family arabinose efflux permease